MAVGQKTLIAARELLVGWTLREIRDVFDGEGIEPNLAYEPNVPGERRASVEQHYATLGLGKPDDERRLIATFEAILSGTPQELREPALAGLARDGYAFQDGHILPTVGALGFVELERIATNLDAAHLREYIAQMTASVNSNPALAVGTAKELIEACCKTILHARNKSVEGKPRLSALVRATASELRLLPDGVSDEARGADTIRRTLSNLMSVADGIDQLRNLHGSGHGRDGRWRGVTPRPARLAVESASTLCTVLMETHLAQEPWADSTTLDRQYIAAGFDDGRTGAEINLIKLGDGRVEAQGFARWVDPAQPTGFQSPHTGQFHTRVTPRDGSLVVQDGECSVHISRRGLTLTVSDSDRCGGMNVSFSGDYRRVGPPPFVDT